MSTLPQRHPPTTMTTTPPTNDVGASGVNESRTVAVKLVTSLPPKYRVADTVIRSVDGRGVSKPSTIYV